MDQPTQELHLDGSERRIEGSGMAVSAVLPVRRNDHKSSERRRFWPLPRVTARKRPQVESAPRSGRADSSYGCSGRCGRVDGPWSTKSSVISSSAASRLPALTTSSKIRPISCSCPIWFLLVDCLRRYSHRCPARINQYDPAAVQLCLMIEGQEGVSWEQWVAL